MGRSPSPSHSWAELTLIVGAFGVLLAYTYALFFRLPYVGFEWDVGRGLITDEWSSQTPGLQIGDTLLSVNGLTIEQYRRDLWLELFPSDTPPQFLFIEFERAGTRQTLTWQVTGQTWAELFARLQSQWFIAWVFWVTGALAFLVLRPRDIQWRLFILFNVLTALWLCASTLARWHFGGSAFVLRSAVWWSWPVYWHFHWLYPQPLGRVPRWFLYPLYSLAALFTVADWFSLLPLTLYQYGLALAILGAVLFLMARLFIPAQRAAVRPLLVAVLAAFGPTLILISLTANGQATITSAAGLLALPALPLFYFYAAYRRHLGSLEVRANRLLAAYLFLLGLVIAVGLMASFVNIQALETGEANLIWLAAIVGVAMITVFAFPRFERWVERRLLGVKVPSAELLETFSAQLVLSPDATHLGQWVERTVLPTWLIRQSCLLRWQAPDQLSVVYTQGVPTDFQLPALSSESDFAAQVQVWAETQAWVRLALPLKVQDQWVGLWLVGRRDPDDFYSARDRAALQVLANQMAIAFAHFHQTERLRQLYEVNVDRHEAERQQLALHLHDEILNNLASLKTSSPMLQNEGLYQRIVQQVRYLVSDLRPVMLAYGLRQALEQLAEDLADRTALTIQANLGETDVRYPATVEQHLYRIVQQAAENACQHARASAIVVTGQLAPENIQLRVIDDGVGLPPSFTRNLHQLLAQRHFGLAGMYERADLAGAQLIISSTPTQGTRVEIIWPAPNSNPL